MITLERDQLDIEGVGTPTPPTERNTVAKYTSKTEVIKLAGSLLSDNEENPEYDRALVELTGNLLGLDTGSDEVRETILLMLRALAS
jgi:hypothetical protein